MEPTPGALRMAVRRTLIVSGACFVLLALAVALAGTPPGDVALRDTVLALAAPPVLTAMHAINVAGSWRLLLPATLLLLAAFAEARRRWWVWVGLMVAAPLTEGALKWVIGRPRPEGLSLGFPSGHATAAAAFFGALIYLAAALPAPARRLARALAVAVVVLVAAARVMLRAHWPSDALAGVALGLALASVAALLSSSSADPARARRGS
ncbi:MAG: phosphatase PAP2 family protein [Candidatus Rokubacteria bacterium]|nr:phosphatase PAP2 family protein [Candidatus Rokubacteria bacterium]